MPTRVGVNGLNASTIDILNVIRQNATYEYQSMVPEVTKTTDIPKVGEVLYGNPVLQNQFLNALINRIALVLIKSSTFNNPYADLKKGYLEYGETVEEVFVNICKAREFSVEKAEAREFKRSISDVRSAFHVMNMRYQFPLTVQDEDLRQAFLSAEGVSNFIAKLVDSVYRSNEYVEYLLFKYLLIKSIAHGKMFPQAVSPTDMHDNAEKFRGVSNMITILSPKYNASGVHTNTPKEDQYIFMDAMYNAKYDVEVLASAFHMDKADFMGRLKIIDDWSTFDNDAFSEIVASSDGFEPVTAEELAITAKVKAVLVDKEFFQVYDNNMRFTEKYVASGMYWNYFLNVWKTVSYSPFSNAVVFVEADNVSLNTPATLTVEVTDKIINEGGTILTLSPQEDTPTLTGQWNFVQTQDAVEKMIAVQKYGVLIFPTTATTTKPQLILNGVEYNATTNLTTAAQVGSTLTFERKN